MCSVKRDGEGTGGPHRDRDLPSRAVKLYLRARPRTRFPIPILIINQSRYLFCRLMLKMYDRLIDAHIPSL